MMEYINLNGKIVSESEGVLPATSRAVAYGDGCFETFRSYNGKFLNFTDHFKRLQEGLNYLGMDSELTEEKFRKEIQELLIENDLENKDSVVRIQCFRKGGAGYTNLSGKSGFLISTREVRHKSSTLKLKTVSIRAIPSIALERKVKLSNSINYIKAAQEAEKEYCDDALMLTIDGFISETTIANIFWIKDSQVFTPSVNCDLLPGIIRSIIIDLINEDPKLSIGEGVFKPEDLYKAEAVFCTNSVMEIKAVSMIDGYSYETDNFVMKKLRDDFKVYKETSLKSD